jgi:hypothetical protein
MTPSRYIPKTLDAATKSRLREIIRTEPWKPASSPQYKDAPHSYLIAYNYPVPETGVSRWKFFADAIAQCGEYRTWKHRFRYKYLIIDGYCYWTDFPALNRAKADTLDPKNWKPEF